MQLTVTQMLTGSNKYEHVTPVLRKFHWLPIIFRAQFKMLVLTF